MIEKMEKAAEVIEKTPERTNKNDIFNPDKRLDTGLNEEKTERQKEYNPDERIGANKAENTDVLDVSETLKKLVNEYCADLVKCSEYPETLKDLEINPAELKAVTVEKHNELRKDFGRKKNALIKEWEKANGVEWPRYEKDVYDSNGNKIRKAGDRYDAHHKVPLSLGGGNTADNITPLRADLHYDHRGIHAKESACSQMQRIVKGIA